MLTRRRRATPLAVAILAVIVEDLRLCEMNISLKVEQVLMAKSFVIKIEDLGKARQEATTKLISGMQSKVRYGKQIHFSSASFTILDSFKNTMITIYSIDAAG